MHDIPARLGQMRLRDLRLLDFVARLKTLGKIAEQLHLTQPAVTQALQALDADRDFLKAGDVFSDDFIDSYIAMKMQEVTRFRAATHPLEYQMYYTI